LLAVVSIAVGFASAQGKIEVGRGWKRERGKREEWKRDER
jgi:hypothetical protein